MQGLNKQAREIANHYGLESQMSVAQEECAELIQAISKLRRAGKWPQKTPEGREALLPIMKENAKRNLSSEEIGHMEKEVIRCGGVKRTVEEIHRYAALAGEILDSLEDIPEARKIRRMLDKLESM